MRRSLRPNQYLRMIENRFVTSEGSFISLDDWDAIVDPDMRPLLGDKAVQIVAGIDASVRHDSTALVAASFDWGPQRCRLVAHRVFQPSPDEPLDFEGTVERTVLEWWKHFQLQAVYFDPWQMVSTSQRLAKHGVKVEEFPQSVGNLTLASQTLYELIRGRNLIVYPNETMQAGGLARHCRRDVEGLAHREGEAVAQNRCGRRVGDGLLRRDAEANLLQHFEPSAL